MQNECTSTRTWRTAVVTISLHTRISETLSESIVSGSGHVSKKLKENLVSGGPALLSEKFKALQFSLCVQKHDKTIIWLLTAISCVSRDFWQFIFINQNRQGLLSESCLDKFTVCNNSSFTSDLEKQCSNSGITIRTDKVRVIFYWTTLYCRADHIRAVCSTLNILRLHSQHPVEHILSGSKEWTAVVMQLCWHRVFWAQLSAQYQSCVIIMHQQPAFIPTGKVVSVLPTFPRLRILRDQFTYCIESSAYLGAGFWFYHSLSSPIQIIWSSHRIRLCSFLHFLHCCG